MTIPVRSKILASVALLGGGALAFAFLGPGAPVLAGDGCCGGGGGAAAAEDGSGHGGGAGAEQEGSGSGESAGKTESTKAGAVVIDLGNPKCPIMGGKVDGKTWSEWNGLRIGHCCGMCTAKFAKDPAKALDAAKVEWRAAAAAVKKVNDAKPEERAKALAELQAKWTVVAGADAAKTASAAAQPATGPLLVDLGNAKCPIMGGKADGKTWSEWNGLRIGHCCGMCTAKFAKDPAKALDAAKIEWRAAAAAVKKVNDAKPEERAKALAALKDGWTVVREPAPAPAPPSPGK